MRSLQYHASSAVVAVVEEAKFGAVDGQMLRLGNSDIRMFRERPKHRVLSLMRPPARIDVVQIDPVPRGIGSELASV